MSIEKEESYFSDNDSRLERKVSRFLRLLLYIGIVCCFCMVFLTVRHTIGRYGFNSPTPGNAELTTLCMLVLVMLVKAVGIVTVATVGRPPGGLNIGHIPGFRPQCF